MATYRSFRPSDPTHISIESLLNQSSIGSGLNASIAATLVNQLGVCSNRAALSVTDTAQQITIGTDQRTMFLWNNGTAPVYIGGSSVDATNGAELVDGSYFFFNNVRDDFSFYIVCAAADSPQECRIIEFT